MKTTLHNSVNVFKPQQETTIYRTTKGKAIFLETSHDGTKTYVTRKRELVFNQSPNGKVKASTVTSYAAVAPSEHTILFKEYPERFAMHRLVLSWERQQNSKFGQPVTV